MMFKDAPYATLLVVRETMGDGRGDADVREAYYVRREGPMLGRFAPTYGVATTQVRAWRG